MTPPPSLKTAMTPFPFSIAPEETVAAARALMDEHAIRHLPVAEEHRPLGIVTAHDLVGQPREGLVRDAFVSEVYAVELDAPLAEVLTTMAERHIGSVVVTRLGRIAGVFTWVDACRCLGAYLDEAFPRPSGDEAA